MNQESILEGILFAMGEPVDKAALALGLQVSEQEAEELARGLAEKYIREDRGIRLLRLEDSYQLCSAEACYDALTRIAVHPRKPVMTNVLMETLAIIAYKQPVTKAEIARIRGVNSDFAVNKLIDFGLICESGRLNAPGRPILFATTQEFLRRYHLEDLDGLPGIEPDRLEEIREEAEEEAQSTLAADGGSQPAEPQTEGGETGGETE